MITIKKIFLFIALFSCTCFSKEIPEKYFKAMTEYNNNNFLSAYELFTEFGKEYVIEDEFSATAYYYTAESLVKMEKLDAAITSFEIFLDRFKWSGFMGKALYELGFLYYKSDQYFKSREKFLNLVKKYPLSENVGSAFYFVGETYSLEGNYYNAIDFFERAISSKKNKFPDKSIYALAGVYEKRQDYNKAVAYYDTLLGYYKNSDLAPDAQVRIGVCYFMLKEYDNTVLELSDPLIDQLPDKQLFEARYVLGHSFYRLKEYSNAEKTFKELVVKNPSSPIIRDTRYALAWSYFQQAKYEDAYKIFNLLAKGGEDSIAINSYFWSAECKRYEGKESEANLIYESFLEKYPDSQISSKVKLQLGLSNFTTNKTAVSEDVLLSSANSGNMETKNKAFTLLGELKLNQNNFSEAKVYFEKAVAIENIPDNNWNRALLGLAISEYYLKEYEDAVKNLKSLVVKAPKFESDKVNFYLAESYFASKEYANSLKYYNLIKTTDNELNSQVLYGKGYAYFNLKDYNNASFCFADFIKQFKNNKNYSDARLRLADCYFGLKKYSDAGRIYKEIFSSDSQRLSNDYVAYQYAQALYKSGNSQEAIDEFNKLQTRFPNSKYIEESQYIIGWIYFQKSDFHSAIKNYKILIDRYSKSNLVPVTFNSIGNSYFNLGKYDSASYYYNLVIDNYPSSGQVFDAINGLKDTYIAEDKPDMAISVIDNFISKNPNISFADQVFLKKGDIYYSLRNYQNAVSSYNQFINFYTKSNLIPDAYYWIGKSYRNMGQPDDALKNFNAVTEKQLNSEIGIASVLEIGGIYKEQGNNDKAIEIYSKALDNLNENPKVAEIAYNKAMAYIDKGDISKAYEDFNFVIQYYNASLFAAASKYEIALIEMSRRNYETSDMLLKELSENRDDDIGAKAQYNLGVSLMEQNKIDDAITAFVRVRFVFSGYDEWLTKSYLKLGECYIKKNDTQKAKEIFRTVAASHGGDSYGAEAKKKLRELQ